MTINQRLFSLLDNDRGKPKLLAEYIGIKENTLSTWKNRGTDPPSDKIILICDFFGVDLFWFLTGRNKNESAFTKEERELINYFRLLPDKEKWRFIGNIESKAEIYSGNNTERNNQIKRNL